MLSNHPCARRGAPTSVVGLASCRVVVLGIQYNSARLFPTPASPFPILYVSSPLPFPAGFPAPHGFPVPHPSPSPLPAVARPGRPWDCRAAPENP